jgi:hypothetical protein
MYTDLIAVYRGIEYRVTMNGAFFESLIPALNESSMCRTEERAIATAENLIDNYRDFDRDVRESFYLR